MNDHEFEQPEDCVAECMAVEAVYVAKYPWLGVRVYWVSLAYLYINRETS